MPTYEYECQSCNQRFEKFQNMTDKPVRSCPQCDGSVRRLLGAGSAVIFRGSGSGRAVGGRDATRCGRDNPCCGRAAPCNAPPCDH